MPKKRPVSLMNMSYLSDARSSNGFPRASRIRGQNQTPPKGRHLKPTTLIIRLTWVPNKMQPRHLQESLTPLSRGPGTLQSQRCSLPLSQHIWRAANRPRSTLLTIKRRPTLSSSTCSEFPGAPKRMALFPLRKMRSPAPPNVF